MFIVFIMFVKVFFLFNGILHYLKCDSYAPILLIRFLFSKQRNFDPVYLEKYTTSNQVRTVPWCNKQEVSTHLGMGGWGAGSGTGASQATLGLLEGER